MGNSTIINKKGYIFGRDTYSIIRLESYFLKENQIKEERERIILEAMGKLFLGRDDAILAMIYYDWNTPSENIILLYGFYSFVIFLSLSCIVYHDSFFIMAKNFFFISYCFILSIRSCQY